MGNENPRSYSCKDEEVPVMGTLLLLSFKRNITGFRAFSPKFNEAYVTGYETLLATAREVVEPQSETLAKKLITEKLHQKIEEVQADAKQLKGYLELGREVLHISPAEFGVNALIESCKSLNLEGVLKQLNLVVTNVNVHKAPLMDEGLSQEKIDSLTAAGAELTSLKEQQYTIHTNRKRLVQENVATFNELWSTMSEIMAIGKLLYNDTDKVKAQEFTLKGLEQQVHRTTGTPATPDEVKKQTPTA